MQELEMKFYSNRSPKKGYSWETPPQPIPEDQIAETVTTEVLVIGGGISGLAASARCADKGLKVITLDKNEKTLALAGQIAAVNSRIMAEKGITIDKKKIEIPGPIKQAGRSQAVIKLYQDVSAKITVEVTV